MRVSRRAEKEIRELVKRRKLNLVVLFGSHAKGTANGESDTDIAVRGAKPMPLKTLLLLAVEFDKILGPCGFSNCEVVDVRHSPPLLLAAIAQHGALLFQAARSDFSNFKISAFNQFCDFKSWRDKMAKRNRETIKRWF